MKEAMKVLIRVDGSAVNWLQMRKDAKGKGSPESSIRLDARWWRDGSTGG